MDKNEIYEAISKAIYEMNEYYKPNCYTGEGEVNCLKCECYKMCSCLIDASTEAL